MHDLLSQIYNTGGNIASNDSTLEKTAEAELLETLEKVAAAEGIDLSQFNENDIAEILGEALGQEVEGQTKEAAVEEAVEEAVDADLNETDKEKLAEADFLGRLMAHALYDELTSINNGGEDQVKEAANEEFEDAATARAMEILEAAGVDVEQTKESAAEESSADEAVTARAAELLSENGWDIDELAQAIESAGAE